MSNVTNWPQLIKQMSKEEREASKPCDVITGTVISTGALKVSIRNGIILDGDFLSVCENVSGKLRTGDTVMLIRQSGGQHFFLVDRLV